MATTNYKFNLLKYVYGRLYAGTFNFNCVKENRNKINSWRNVLNWLQREGYITSYNIDPVGNGFSQLTYTFNHNKVMYERYLKAIERNVSQYTIPGGEMVVKVEKSEWAKEYENTFKKPTKYIYQL